MGMILKNQNIMILVPASEVFPQCRLVDSKAKKDSDVTGYYTDDNQSKKQKIVDFFNNFDNPFFISFSFLKAYKNQVELIKYKIKNLYKNNFESFDKNIDFFTNVDIEIPKMKFGGETNRYLKFENSDEIIKRFKELIFEDLTSIIIEKEDTRFLVYLVINPDYKLINDNLGNRIIESSNIKKNEYSSYLNLILYGPPGTGKTFTTSEIALALIEKREPSISFFDDKMKAKLMTNYHKYINENRIVFCTFHQNFSYEDFIEGYKPSVDSNGILTFKLIDGIFKKTVKLALNQPNQEFVLIIDEINRANISKVFGELITLIEFDKRIGQENPLYVTLPSGEKFGVPNNLHLLGTMNTADKSISLIDIALRRRFNFIEVPPNYSFVQDPNLKEIMININDYLKQALKNNDLLIGHSYFMTEPKNLPFLLNEKIIPLLYEYFNDNEDKIIDALKPLNKFNIEIIESELSRIKVSIKWL